MPCYHPLSGYRSKTVNPNGKRSIVFNVTEAEDKDKILTIPCGQCIGCRLDRSREWAVRCVNEASLYDRNCFITLTYDSENLPSNGSLVKSDFQKFMKRLRREYGNGIRYYHCGEYGDNFGRPHYHAILFNHDFSDKEIFSVRDDVRLYTSNALSLLWPFGISSVGDVTFESCAYVARYIMKKQNGDLGLKKYGAFVDEFGNVDGYVKQPEYTTMSRRPGVGYDWYKKWTKDVFPSDEVIIRGGIAVRPPKYYLGKYELDNPEDWEDVKFKREIGGQKSAKDNTPERLIAREKCRNAKLKQLKRGYENET